MMTKHDEIELLQRITAHSRRNAGGRPLGGLVAWLLWIAAIAAMLGGCCAEEVSVAPVPGTEPTEEHSLNGCYIALAVGLLSTIAIIVVCVVELRRLESE